MLSISRAFKIGIWAALPAAVVFAASPALAATGWTIVSSPPTGQNAFLSGVSADSGSDAWAVGSENAEANGVGAKMVIDHWNGSAWSQVTAPAIAGTAEPGGGQLQRLERRLGGRLLPVQRYTFYPLAVQWNGTSWSINTGLRSALPENTLNGVTDISPTDAYAFGNNASMASGVRREVERQHLVAGLPCRPAPARPAISTRSPRRRRTTCGWSATS